MSLRKAAIDLASRTGLRAGVVSTQTSTTAFGSAIARGFATVMDGFKYAKSHEYVKMDGDVATVGISDFAQSELGDVVYVELPEVGSELKKGETFGVVESVKAASDVYAPVSGEVLEVNEGLSDDPSQVNSSPFEGGWMMKNETWIQKTEIRCRSTARYPRVDDNPEGTIPARTGQNESTMFPGWSLTSEQLQDIKNNERPQTLVVSGFTGRNHMFVQPIRGGGGLNGRGVGVTGEGGRGREPSAATGATGAALITPVVATAAFTPSWVKYHGAVLSFTAVSARGDGGLNHSFQILYHLSDGTYEVKQGGKVFLKRLIGNSSSGVETRYAKPDPYAIEIGDEVDIAGHVFRVVDADRFTREHIEEVRGVGSDGSAGVSGLGAPIVVVGRDDGEVEGPEWPATATRPRASDASDVSNTTSRKITSYLSRGEDLKEMFKESTPASWRGVVLHAWAIEARGRVDGLDRFFISFYPEDSSVQVRVIDPRNERKSSLLLSRTTLVDPLAAVLGGSALAPAPATARVFEPTDFLVGSHIKLCGREMRVYKLFGASAAWITENIEGVDGARLREICVDDDKAKGKERGEHSRGAREKDRRPESDAGTEADADAFPAPPVGLDVMQLLAIGADDRRFVVSVHCADSTISIREYTPGKGRVMTQGSKFLQRGHNKVNVADFTVGKTVVINKHSFELIDADRSTLGFIANNPEYFDAARADEPLLVRVRDALCGGEATTVDGLLAIDGLRDVPKAKLISACVLLTASSSSR